MFNQDSFLDSVNLNKKDVRGMLYPFHCQPIYKEKVWGGRWLESFFNRDLSPGKLIGESWELSCRLQEVSIIDHGEFSGLLLIELIQKHPKELLGTRISKRGYDPFPLLIKFLDANNRLSVQVHPHDEYAHQVNPGELGKTEMWYVLDAEPGAKLIMGVTEGVTSEEFAYAIQQGELHKYLTEVPVRPGDAFYIPAGTVHAILEGIRVAEIQQNSDTTYRVYDWNRMGLDGKPRQLHIKEALDVIDFQKIGINPHPGVTFEGKGWMSRLLTACRYFAVEEMCIQQMTGKINPERFEIWMVLEGSGVLETNGGVQILQSGQTWVIPASTGNYQLNGQLKILHSFIPDLEEEIVAPLLARGYSRDELYERIGGLNELRN